MWATSRSWKGSLPCFAHVIHFLIKLPGVVKRTVEWRASYSSFGPVITEARGPLHLADIESMMPTVGEAVGEPGHIPSMAVFLVKPSKKPNWKSLETYLQKIDKIYLITD